MVGQGYLLIYANDELSVMKVICNKAALLNLNQAKSDELRPDLGEVPAMIVPA